MNILVTICARKGSKRLKNKNIRNLAGKPLLFYAIDLAKEWGAAKRIICSTDSEKIASMAEERGIEVPFMRPAELADDHAGKVDVLRHALKKCEELYDEKYDVLVDLDVTSPIRNKDDMNKCLEIFEKKKPESLFSVTKARKNPYFNVVERKPDGEIVLSKPKDAFILRNQDCPEVYDMNAAIYFYDRKFLLNESNVHPLSVENVELYVMDEIAAFDIDTDLDFKIVEFLIKNEDMKL